MQQFLVNQIRENNYSGDMVNWMIHLDDGKTLTDEDTYPPGHEQLIIDLASRGCTLQNITSIERLINGRHLTIRKSPFTEMFFVATEMGADMRMSPGPQPPHNVLRRTIGCHLIGSDPPVQCRLTMDPKNFDVSLSLFEVVEPTMKGINAQRLNPPKKGSVFPAWQKDLIDNVYTVINSNVIKSVHGTPTGLCVILNNPKIRAEIVIRSQNVLLGFMEKGQRLKLKET
ncbi:hypothetical protein KKH23_04335 [Patescibacteria group bacterium]|nr:hypothetical protein [Patescibacteria group bacterium]